MRAAPSRSAAGSAAFELSYRDLTADQQRMFRRLGLHPGADTDAWAAAALDGIDPAAAERHLQALNPIQHDHAWIGLSTLEQDERDRGTRTAGDIHVRGGRRPRAVTAQASALAGYRGG